MVCVNHSGDEIHDSHCSAQKRPNQSEPCNTQPCEFVWITGDWEEVKKMIYLKKKKKRSL